MGSQRIAERRRMMRCLRYGRDEMSMPTPLIQRSQEDLFGLVLQRDAEQLQNNAQDKQQRARPCFWGEEHQRCAQHHHDHCTGAPGTWILYHMASPAIPWFEF